MEDVEIILSSMDNHNERDMEVLFSLRKAITFDPYGFLSN
jgi:hypothetical protein